MSNVNQGCMRSCEGIGYFKEKGGDEEEVMGEEAVTSGM